MLTALRTVGKHVHSLHNRRMFMTIPDLSALSSLLPIIPVAAVAALTIPRYKVAKAEEKIVVTGPFVGDKEMKICKTAFIWPFQKYKFISSQAHSISTIVSAMTKEKIPFDMPMFFTICPDDGEESTLSLYAKKFGDMDQESIDETIKSVVIGEARLLTGGLDIDALFSNRDEFKSGITNKIQICLDPFGLKVDNVNIGELKDSHGSDYFKNMSERALQKAQREATVATAEHMFNTKSEEKSFEGESRKRVAATESDAMTTENLLQQNIVKSKTELKVFEANQNQMAELARLQAEAIAKMKEIDYQREIEEKRREQMIEQQKANELSKAIVDKDKLMVETEAGALKIRMLADAQAYETRVRADADLYAKQKEAEGELAVQTAKAEGLKRNVQAAGGTIKDLESYKMVDEGRHENIAQKFAEGVKGLNPTIFTNGSDGSVSKVMSDIAGSVSAMASAYKKNTGIDLMESFKGAANANVDKGPPKIDDY